MSSEGNMNLDVHGKVGGFYRLQVTHADGSVDDTGWFPNLITNQGLDWIGGNAPYYNTPSNTGLLNTHCGVGVGSTAPAYTDTHLTSALAMYPSSAGSNQGSGPSSYVAGTPPYWTTVWTYSFATGAVIGNIAEVGVGCTISTDTTPQLFSHALILDSLGSPTTISVTSGDALTVTYELRYYIDTTDNTYSMTIASVVYTGTYRRMVITTAPPIYYPVLVGTYTTVASLAYSGFSLGLVTGNPTYSGVAGNTNFTYSSAAYISGTYYVSFTTTVPLAQANFASYISGFSTQCNHGSYQFSISPVIPKTSSYVLTITWNVSWARYP